MLAATVMLVCLAATAVVYRSALQAARDDLQLEFEFRVRETVDSIDRRMRVYAQVLRGAQGMLSIAGYDRGTFRSYVESLHIQENYPGFQDIGVSLIVPRGEMANHVESARRQGFPDYAARPEGKRETASSIVQIESLTERNLRAIGYDMLSEPVRRTAMERARDTGSIGVTAKVALMQETDRDAQTGFLMYLPLYRKGRFPDTLDGRRANIVGWVYTPIRMGDLIAGIGGERAADIDLEIYDGDGMAIETLMYDRDGKPLSALGDAPLLKAVHRLEMGGHVWTLALHPQPGLKAHGHMSRPKAVAAIGIVLSLLLGMLTYLLATGRATALAVAASLTRRLKESEEVLKFAVAGSGDGVWDWNVQSGLVRYSRRWKEMLGYAESDIGDHVEEWRARVHPDDLARVLSDLDAYFKGEKSSYANEHRLRCKSGEWKWILDRGAIVSRTAEGQPLRIVGTHADITSRREAEERERRLKNLYSALSAINEAIIHGKDESSLFSELCRIAVEYGGMPLAWVGRPDADGRLVPLASRSTLKNYLDGLFVTVAPGVPEGEGPAGLAYRGQRAVVFNDIGRDATFAPWRAKALAFGLRAGAAFPITRAAHPYAILLVYSNQIGAFDDEIVQLLNRMADNVSFAIDNLDREAARNRRESEIRVLFENASDGIFITDRSGRHIDVNQRGASMLGYAKSEVLQLDIAGIIAERERSRVPIEMAGWSETPLMSEWTFRRKDGSEFFGEVNSQLLPDGRVIGIVRDVTERRQNEERQQLAATVFHNAGEAMTVTDAEANIVAVNPAFTELTGYAAEEVIGKNPRILKSGRHDEAFYREMWDSILTTGHWQGEIWNRRKNGHIYPERLSINTIYSEDGTVRRYVAMFQDITNEKQAEETIRALSANHIEVREQEGKRIAREIHDDLGQRLTLLRMDLLMLPKALDAPSPELSEAVARMRTSIDDCIRIARNIVAELRPAVLDIGIVPAIEWLLDDFEARTGIECLFHNLVSGDIFLDEHQSIGIFRILQESLNNVTKHARATCVEVDMETKEGRLCIKIADNGIGLEAASAGRSNTYGLTGMRERAAMLGGSFRMEGRPGKGTTLQVCIPLVNSDSTIP